MFSTTTSSGVTERAASVLIQLGRISRNRLTTYSIVACVAAGCLWVTCLSVQRSLWIDEAWVANSATGRSLADVFYYKFWLQTSPPLFLLLVRALVAIFGITNATLRATPLLMGVLSTTAMALLASRLLSRPYALLAWTLFTLSPITIAFSSTLKQYSSELAATTVVLLVCILYLERATSGRFYALVAAVSLGLLLGYPVAFILPGIILTVCLTPVPSDSAFPSSTNRTFVPLLRGITLALAAGSILIGEYVLLISHNTSPVLYSFWKHDRGVARAVLMVGARLLNLLPISDRLLVRSEAEGVTAGAVFVAAGFGVLLVAGFVSACLRFRSGERKWLEIQVLCGTPCLLVIICEVFSWYPMSRGTSLFLLPCFVMLLICSLQLIANFVRRTLRSDWLRALLDITVVVVTLLVIVAGARKIAMAEPRVPEEDAASAVSYLRQHVHPGDILWVHASTSETFKLYERILHWTDSPVRYGQTGWPCCPRGVVATRGASTEDAVRRDIDNGIPDKVRGRIWLLYTTRSTHWEFVGLDESQITRSVFAERGCVEMPTPTFHNIGISSFDCRQ